MENSLNALGGLAFELQVAFCLLPITAVVVVAICHGNLKEGILGPILSMPAGGFGIYLWYRYAPSIQLLGIILAAAAVLFVWLGAFLTRFRTTYTYSSYESKAVGQDRLDHGCIVTKFSCYSFAIIFTLCLVYMIFGSSQSGQEGGALTIAEWGGLLSMGISGLVVSILLAKAAREFDSKTILISLAVGLIALALWYFFGPTFGVWKYVSALSALVGGFACVGTALYIHKRLAMATEEKAGRATAVVFAVILIGIGVLTVLRAPKIDEQLRRVIAQKELLQQKANKDIPDFRARLLRQVEAVKAELNRSHASGDRSLLNSEAEEIARALLAVDAFNNECRESMSRLSSVERRLSRARDVGRYLGSEQDELVSSFASATREASAKLSVQLDMAIGGGGAVEDMAVESKVQELFR